MRLFVFFLFAFSLVCSQQLFELDSLDLYDDLNTLDSNSSIEINNIGDPVLFLLFPPENNDFSLSHYSQKVRLVDYDKKEH